MNSEKVCNPKAQFLWIKMSAGFFDYPAVLRKITTLHPEAIAAYHSGNAESFFANEVS